MAYASEPDTLVLHALRLKGFAEADAVAVATGLALDVVTKHLDAAEREGLVKHRQGAVSGWTLTAAGRAEGERRLAHELDAAGVRGDVTHAYQRFLVLNPSMLQVCTDWQMREVGDTHVVNDHSDEAYDAGVVERLAALDAEVQPICRDLHALLQRFEGYGARLEDALTRVRAGDRDWFTKPTIDSYHTVWFELHENLLATLGIERGEE